MGDLPAARVNRTSIHTARALIHTGVNYANSIAVRTTPSRGHKSHKGLYRLIRMPHDQDFTTRAH